MAEMRPHTAARMVALLGEHGAAITESTQDEFHRPVFTVTGINTASPEFGALRASLDALGFELTDNHGTATAVYVI